MVLCTLAKYDSSIPLQKKKKSAQTTYFCHYSKHCLPFKLENMLTFTVFLMIFFVRFLLWWTSLSSSLNILTFNQATWNRPWVTLQHSQCHRWGNNNCLLFNCFNIFCLPEDCLGTSQWYYSNHILNIFPLCMVHIRNYA